MSSPVSNSQVNAQLASSTQRAEDPPAVAVVQQAQEIQQIPHVQQLLQGQVLLAEPNLQLLPAHPALNFQVLLNNEDVQIYRDWMQEMSEERDILSPLQERTLQTIEDEYEALLPQLQLGNGQRELYRLLCRFGNLRLELGRAGMPPERAEREAPADEHRYGELVQEISEEFFHLLSVDQVTEFQNIGAEFARLLPHLEQGNGQRQLESLVNRLERLRSEVPPLEKPNGRAHQDNAYFGELSALLGEGLPPIRSIVDPHPVNNNEDRYRELVLTIGRNSESLTPFQTIEFQEIASEYQALLLQLVEGSGQRELLNLINRLETLQLEIRLVDRVSEDSFALVLENQNQSRNLIVQDPECKETEFVNAVKPQPLRSQTTGNEAAVSGESYSVGNNGSY